MKRFYAPGFVLVALVLTIGCGSGGNAPPPEPTPTPAPTTCRIVPNTDGGFPAVYRSVRRLSNGEFDVVIMRVLREEADGSISNEQSDLLLQISGTPGNFPGCEEMVKAGFFRVFGDSRDRGGVTYEFFADCITESGLVATWADTEGACEPLIMHLPDDEQPLPNP